MSLGLLFPGQGSQHADMLPWLADGPPQPTALALLEIELGGAWRQRLGDTAWATGNRVAQSLVTGINLAAWQQLQPLLPAPGVVAGYSVGELAAYCAAGVFDISTALRLARQRAAIMDDCAQTADTGLLAINAATPALIERLCRSHDLAIAIRIGPGRCILGGLRTQLLAAERDAVLAGASASLLGIALASHTRWLSAGVAPFEAVLAATAFAVPRTALVCNFSGHVERHVAPLRDALGQQMASTVWWDHCMDAVAERGVRCVLEVGPGSALSRMWNDRFPDIPARSSDEFQRASGAASWVAERLARA